eukprot:188265-Alexandrium_andersonii.AAC.1
MRARLRGAPCSQCVGNRCVSGLSPCLAMSLALWTLMLSPHPEECCTPQRWLEMSKCLGQLNFKHAPMLDHVCWP